MAGFETVVIGGGVIGVSAAYYLAVRGARVILLEQDEICSGCSRGNAGQITPGHLPLPQPGTLGRNLRWLLSPTSPLYIAPRPDPVLLGWLWRFQRHCNADHLRRATELLCRLGAASVPLFEELASRLPFAYQSPGRLEVCRTAATLEAACAEARLLEEFNFSWRRLSEKEARQLEPAIEGPVAGAVYYPDSGYCNPHRFVAQLAEAAVRCGAEIRTRSQVVDLQARHGRPVRVVTRTGQIEADTAVLACGAWTPHLAGRLGLRLPVQPGKGYHLDVALAGRRPAIPVVLVEERIFVTPVDGRLRLAGTMEFSGFNLRQRAKRVQMLAAGAARYLPRVAASPVESRWCHLRPMTPDGLPVIGKVPGAENVWVATGHGMLGVTQGPITGKLIAEWITEGRPSMDLGALRADRF